MVKLPQKTQENLNIPQNSPNLNPKLDSSLSKNQEQTERIIPKSRQQIYQENYQKNKEKKKVQQKERYYRKKQQTQQQAEQQTNKYYGTEAIKFLMSFKEYTELNQEKKKLWLDFNWTLQDCQRSFKEGYADVVMIMKLEETAHNLVRDYWDTAKSEEKQRSRNWNSLDYDEQQRLIKYWGYEKTRIENNYISESERLEKQSQQYLKEIELAKLHEERGKVKCSCYGCEEKKVIQKEVKAKWKQELKELDQQEADNEKGECNECGKIRVLDEENGLCKKCSESYE